MLVRSETIAAVLPADSLEVRGFLGEIHDCGGKFVTPGLIDCHTHLIWGGSRAAEWEQRLSGVTYAEIAQQGGGILSTVRATRAMSEDELEAAAIPRLRALLAEGVTCVEARVGLRPDTDDGSLKMLRVAHSDSASSSRLKCRRRCWPRPRCPARVRWPRRRLRLTHRG